MNNKRMLAILIFLTGSFSTHGTQKSHKQTKKYPTNQLNSGTIADRINTVLQELYNLTDPNLRRNALKTAHCICSHQIKELQKTENELSILCISIFQNLKTAAKLRNELLNTKAHKDSPCYQQLQYQANILSYQIQTLLETQVVGIDKYGNNTITHFYAGRYPQKSVN